MRYEGTILQYAKHEVNNNCKQFKSNERNNLSKTRALSKGPPFFGIGIVVLPLHAYITPDFSHAVGHRSQSLIAISSGGLRWNRELSRSK